MAKKTNKNSLDTDLTTYRIRLGHTLRDLSHLTGLSAATLNRVERGLSPASAKTMVRLQDALGLSSKQLQQLLDHAVHKPSRGNNDLK